MREVFAFHERADAFAHLVPPWETVEILQPPASLEIGTRVILKQRLGPFWIRIEAEHTEYEKDVRFVDIMHGGPFRSWRHEHRFDREGPHCRLTDTIDYEPPLGPLGRLANPVIIRPRLRKLFDYRHDATARALVSG